MTDHPSGPDLYAVLGVASGTDSTQIRRTYRRLVLALHPDHNPDPVATERFRAVVAAYGVVADPLRRADYDHARTAADPTVRGDANRAAPAPPPPDRPTRPESPADVETDYVPAGEPVAQTDYTPTTGYAPPPAPGARPGAPGSRAGGRARPCESLPLGWPVGRIDHHRPLGRFLLGVWRLAPLPASRVGAATVVAATLAAATLAVSSRAQLPLESAVIGFLALLALACWTVRLALAVVMHLRSPRADERTR
ncbi:J domain-containing protein [Pseudonocardia nematodicida]|uniref:J domain-containing protein n=1 Tax=Pseudonocardia nematodicida TaxID=1206997 RepID=A0ABV1KEI0_9PSEU